MLVAGGEGVDEADDDADGGRVVIRFTRTGGRERSGCELALDLPLSESLLSLFCFFFQEGNCFCC
jgi:hypothetical protein